LFVHVYDEKTVWFSSLFTPLNTHLQPAPFLFGDEPLLPVAWSKVAPAKSGNAPKVPFF